jgi:four helix bundle protein
MSSGQSFAAVATRFAFGTGRARSLCVDDSNETLEPGHDIRVRTFEFACRVVEFCKKLYEQGGVARQMAPQLINCSTSVAAILEEARGAESRRDFISKCSIGLKEARESHVRLRVCHRAALGPPGEAAALVDEARQIASIIGAIVRNSRRNAGITIGPVSRPNSPGAQSL